jgi:pyruvate dehydrogenase E1 component beta subunit
MMRDKTVFVLGEDVGKFGGIFGCTRGLQEEFGEERIRDTPISETAIIGAAIGAAATGMHPIAELEFMDFIGCTMDQVFNQMAKIRYMFGGQIKVPMVLRTPCGSRYPVACGAAHHSQSLEAWFIHVPGLKVAVPSTPYDAKGLLISAIRGEDPVVFVEHKLLYYAKRMPRLREPYPNLIGQVPEEAYAIPFGKADVKRPGEDVTLIATMMMVHKGLRVAEELSKMGTSVEVVDPRTLVPLDKETIINSVKKTGRVVVASEDAKTGGVAAEIASLITEEAFDYLDAPVRRVSALDVPIPYAPILESTVIPQERDIREAVQELTGQ